ncbi:transcription initiation factor TFIID subunit 3 isoform X1 [Neodiprion pinetum]|uniref:transcription initiation factor TFIID subunit 3 isoform X1 n=1 Tax=Neodiprion pinetum TaxID=441929 RepID=UPI001EE141F2|nr:transcription initiation factor TFIID subunit 3 isoform X1 [Neodiprion pinetum]
MAAEYSRNVLRVVVAQICQTIGWHSINSTPLEFLVDLMQEYLTRTSKLTHQYAEVLGKTEPNLDDLGLAFQHMNIDIQELAEYVKNVDSVPCAIEVPKFPVPRESHMNFLKPGSREVVTRPVHVHEHLPAMYPDTEDEYPPTKSENPSETTPEVTPLNGSPPDGSANISPQSTSPQVVFKRPGDPVSLESPIAKRPRVVEEGRPLREIHSVMMTTSGFLSPAREGKLPEARTPQQARSDSPSPSSYPMVPPELNSDKKPKKIVNKKNGEDRKLDKENKKKDRAKELFKPDKIDDSKVKKLAGMKELAKLKALKPGGGKSQTGIAGPSARPSTPKLSPPKPAGSPKPPKVVQPKMKLEKSEPTNSSLVQERKEEKVDKLPSEPDKQKLNIFKKISKPRDDKEKDTTENKHKDLDSRESSPGLIIDENIEKLNRKIDAEAKTEEKKTPHTPDVHVQPDSGDPTGLQSPSSDIYMFDDMSPPGTPSTPKTPELNVPVVIDQKKKRKEKGKKKETKLKSPKQCISPKKIKMSNDLVEPDTPERPKTPQAPEPPLRELGLPPTMPFPFFPTFPPAPGLIPPPIGHPLFPRFPLPLSRGVPHPAMPNLPLPPRFVGLNTKVDDFPPPKSKPSEREKPLPIPAVPSLPIPPAKPEKVEKEKPEKIPKISKHDKEFVAQPITPTLQPSNLVLPVINNNFVTNSSLLTPKSPKVDKIDKKLKEHKKEKKDKLKKKKEKKEKHKEKGEKNKEKKEKGEKKEKAEKIKEKREKKEKRKDKDKEDKAEGVPKITLKLGPASPRPPTPDTTPLTKITIKPLLKKPDDEVKREPSPELAKISALITRPPKQKSTSKRMEDGLLDVSPTFSSDINVTAHISSTPTPRAKKSLFKTLPPRESSVLSYSKTPDIPSPMLLQQQASFYFDQEGRQVWICPACGNQDDGTPMIGCDDCDAWYHWVCVGMQVPPAKNEDWYCRLCIAKKQELHHDKKKKKRKKKVKVTA